MNVFRSLIGQIEEVRSRYGRHRLSKHARNPKHVTQLAGGQTPDSGKTVHAKSSRAPLLLQPGLVSRLNGADSWQRENLRHLFQKTTRSPIVLAVAVVSLTSALGYRFYNAPILDVGRTAPQTLYAPSSVSVEDPKATEESRTAARQGSTSVLKLDQEVNQQTRQLLNLQLQKGTEVRQMAGPFPFARTTALSLPAQGYLRKISDAEWQSILMAVDRTVAGNVLGLEANMAGPSSPPLSEAAYKQTIAELRTYRRSKDLRSFKLLVRQIIDARLKYAAAISMRSLPVSANIPASFNQSLLELTDQDWQLIQKHLPVIRDRMLLQGIAPGLPTNLLQDAVKSHTKGNLSASADAVATPLLTQLLRPNLIRDEAQTRQLAEQAAQGIKPVMVSIRRGEMIVKAGDPIKSGDLALLEHFGMIRRETDWLGLIGLGALVSGGVVVVWLVKQRFNPHMRRRDGILLWLLSLSTPVLIALHMPSTNLPAVGLLIGSFYGAPLGLTVTGLLTLLLAVGVDIQLSHLISSAAGGLLCGWFGGRLRSREELALLGIGVGLLQGTLYLLLNVASGTVWYTLLGASALQGLIGLAWVIVGLGSSAYLEQLFDLVTTIRLVELANPNRPLLKKLAAKAPGTFQHTLFVATLAEAAARALGCNVELVRTGTLYHDIGKMHDPQGFIENQMGGLNKHDVINNPWKSADIIKKHVTEGIVMARKARLPKAVQAFIPEHQGTMLIAYFYHQANQLAQESSTEDGVSPIAVKESDFRYDGPSPQSRETGIVMLADSCEAALRSLKDATPEEALAMINKILRARWQDNQMVDSGLTRDEMTQIANIFVQVWQQFNHQRIAYPKLTPTPHPSPNP